jgi:hypothetical protein
MSESSRLFDVQAVDVADIVVLDPTLNLKLGIELN